MKNLVCAHRGASGSYPENTLIAIQAAIADGADAVEIDIRYTVDGWPVLFHDKNLQRLTGDERKMAEINLNELQNLRIDNTESIATLEEVFEQFGGQIEIVLDIKKAGGEQGIIELIDRFSLSETTIISAFNPKILKTCRKLAPDIRQGLILGKAALLPLSLNFTFYLDHLKSITEVNYLHLEYSRKYLDAYQRLAEKGLKISYWTVNLKEDIKQLKALNPYSIMTDLPEIARKEIDE